MTKWMVMSSTDFTGKSRNGQRCFETNATDLVTEVEAEAEAKRRNAVEKAAGHTNVMWYHSPQLDLAALMGAFK